MQGVAIDGGGVPRIRDLPAPVPGPGELVLRMRWSGLCGTDLYKLEAGNAPVGAVLGHEVVGEVTSTGAGVSRFAANDRVVVPHHVACGACFDCRTGAETQCAAFRENLLEPGGFAEQILVRARAVAVAARRVPDGLDDLDAIFLEPAACVLRSLRKTSILSSISSVLPLPGVGAAANEASICSRVAVILGGGSMGLLHLLLLRALRAPALAVVVDPRADRRRLALELGANDAVAPGEALLSVVRARSRDARGADAVFDCVGGSALAETALAILRPGGAAVIFAYSRADEGSGLALNDLFKHEKRLVGAYSGSVAEQSAVWDLLCSGDLRPSRLVSHRLPLAHFATGVDLARRQEALKVAFHP